MQSPLLAGVRSKIGRAEHHFNDLHERIKSSLSTVTSGKDISPVFESNDEGQTIIKLPEDGCQLDPSLPMIIGDCVHNTRSALDHLIYQLAILNGAGPCAASETSFPIYLKEKVFKDVVKKKIAPYISTAALAELALLQPYATSDPPELDMLWQLSQLDNIDKHRIFVVVGREFRMDSFEMTLPNGEKFITSTPDSKWKPSVGGTEIVRFDFAGNPGPIGKVHVKVKTATTVKFSNTAPFCDGRVVEQLLHECAAYVCDVVDHFGRLFFGE